MPSLYPEATEVEQVIAQRLAALSDSTELKETVTIEWRDKKQRAIEVISMPLSLVKYNPDTHRIRAQRSLDPERDRDLSERPYGEEGQKYLHYLLMGDSRDPSTPDADFLDLKADLKENGQEQPGIMTRRGVLINGNTRAAALRELGEDSIRVGVLPSDGDRRDFDSVELSLQLRPEYRRNYSFMNMLLAVEERRNSGWQPERIMSEFRVREGTLERNLWILAAIREVIERSETTTPDGKVHKLRLIDFERHQGKLEELHRAYKTLKAKSPDEAEAMREQRLLAIVLDRSKTDVRLIGPGFAKQYMPAIVPAAPSATPTRTIPGTKIAGSQPTAAVASLKQLTNDVLKARAVEAAGDAVATEARAVAGEELAKVRDELREALTKADIKAKEQTRKAAAADRLGDANDDLDLTIEAIVAARATQTFDPDDLDDALVTMRTRLGKLARETAKGGAEASGDGLAWLRSVAALDEPE